MPLATGSRFLLESRWQQETTRETFEIFQSKSGPGCLLGKRRYYTVNLEGFGRIEISVDESSSLEDSRTLLIEIDSGNMAKLIAGRTESTTTAGRVPPSSSSTITLIARQEGITQLAGP